MRLLLLALLVLPSWAAAATLNWENDNEILDQLSRDGTRLVEKKLTTPKATLLSQFRRQQCRLDLAAKRPVFRDSAAFYERTRAGVIVVAGLYRCRKCAKWHSTVASGFVLDQNGAAVTTCHVLRSPEVETFVAMTSAGDVFPVREVLAANEADDLAVVQLALPPGKVLTALPLAAGEPAAPVGARVRVISHPERHFYLLTEGIIARYLDWPRGSNTIRRVAITADFAVGSSGAPVLNERGEVVAVVCETHTVFSGHEHAKRDPQMTLKLCAPVHRLRRLLQP